MRLYKALWAVKGSVAPTNADTHSLFIIKGHGADSALGEIYPRNYPGTMMIITTTAIVDLTASVRANTAACVLLTALNNP